MFIFTNAKKASSIYCCCRKRLFTKGLLYIAVAVVYVNLQKASLYYAVDTIDVAIVAADGVVVVSSVVAAVVVVYR